jgi:lysophospholipase L1-like esterase
MRSLGSLLRRAWGTRPRWSSGRNRRATPTLERLEDRAVPAALVWGPTTLYVEQVYQDVLGRSADVAGLRIWAAALDEGRLARLQMVQALQSTAEARRAEVNDVARSLVGHPADPASQASLASFLAVGGTLDRVRSLYLGGSEYYARNGGTDADFVAALYRDVLGRPPGPAATSAFLAALGQGATRTNLAAFVLGLPEAREDRAWSDIQRYTRTDPDPALVSLVAGALGRGQREEGLIAFLLTMPAYVQGGWEPEVPADDPDAVPTPILSNSRLAIHQVLKQEARAGNFDAVFLGDSITQLWAVAEAGGPAFRRAFAPLKTGIFGILGDGTGNLLWRLRDGELDGLHPRVVVLQIGTNDIVGTTAEQTAGGIRAVVDDLRARLPGTKILLSGILPRFRPTDPSGLNDKIGLANALIARLDDGGRTVRYNDAGGSFLKPDGTAVPGLFADGAHPTSRGYDILASALLGPLNALLNPAVTLAQVAVAPGVLAGSTSPRKR